jgi:hypothetical protein
VMLPRIPARRGCSASKRTVAASMRSRNER